jgi:hypothetical protein
MVAVASPAKADQWTIACVWNGRVCIYATTGGKNYSNHTQWVGWAQANVFGNSNVTKLETWGDGFYFAMGENPGTYDPSATWGAQRWVHSGTNVCAAATYTNGQRYVACFQISV